VPSALINNLPGFAASEGFKARHLRSKKKKHINFIFSDIPISYFKGNPEPDVYAESFHRQTSN
jgi:hypothetical protein